MGVGSVHIPDVGVLRRAGAALDEAANAALGEHDVGLPLIFGKRVARDAQDARLESAATRARAAALLLEGADHPSIVQARDGATALATHLDEWRTLRGGNRWRHGYEAYQLYSRAQGLGHRLTYAAGGIDAIDAGRVTAWLADNVVGNSLHRNPRLVGTRLMVDARPGRLDPLTEALVPQTDLRGVGLPYTAERFLGWLAMSGPEDRGAAVEGIWHHLVAFGNGASDFGGKVTDGFGNPIDTRTRASVVRALFGATSEHRLGTRGQRPAWLDALADDELIELDIVTRTQLDLLTRATTKADVEQIVLERMLANDRMMYGKLDTGAATYAAAMELPEALRPDLAESVVRDVHAARQSALVTWKAAHDRRLASGASPAAVLADMLVDTRVFFPRSEMYRAGLEVLDRVPTDGQRAQVVERTRELLQRNLERTEGRRTDGYGRHPDYAEHGRAHTNAELLAKLDEPSRRTRDSGTLAW